MKNSSDTIGNPTRDLPACSTVPQPTALPFAPKVVSRKRIVAQFFFKETLAEKNYQNS
jgi:hypothetical protein